MSLILRRLINAKLDIGKNAANKTSINDKLKYKSFNNNLNRLPFLHNKNDYMT